MLDATGWAATAIFSASYFFRRPVLPRRMQAAEACLWIAYGLAIAANAIMAAAALSSARAPRHFTRGPATSLTCRTTPPAHFRWGR